MRKTRLVILPGVRSLNTIGCLLLFLACPNIAFKGQENRDIDTFCKAETFKQFWLQDTLEPGDANFKKPDDILGNGQRLEMVQTKLPDSQAPGVVSAGSEAVSKFGKKDRDRRIDNRRTDWRSDDNAARHRERRFEISRRNDRLSWESSLRMDRSTTDTRRERAGSRVEVNNNDTRMKRIVRSEDDHRNFEIRERLPAVERRSARMSGREVERTPEVVMSKRSTEERRSPETRNFGGTRVVTKREEIRANRREHVQQRTDDSSRINERRTSRMARDYRSDGGIAEGRKIQTERNTRSEERVMEARRYANGQIRYQRDSRQLEPQSNSIYQEGRRLEATEPNGRRVITEKELITGRQRRDTRQSENREMEASPRLVPRRSPSEQLRVMGKREIHKNERQVNDKRVEIDSADTRMRAERQRSIDRNIRQSIGSRQVQNMEEVRSARIRQGGDEKRWDAARLDSRRTPESREERISAVQRSSRVASTAARGFDRRSTLEENSRRVSSEREIRTSESRRVDEEEFQRQNERAMRNVESRRQGDWRRDVQKRHEREMRSVNERRMEQILNNRIVSDRQDVDRRLSPNERDNTQVRNAVDHRARSVLPETRFINTRTTDELNRRQSDGRKMTRENRSERDGTDSRTGGRMLNNERNRQVQNDRRNVIENMRRLSLQSQDARQNQRSTGVRLTDERRTVRQDMFTDERRADRRMSRDERLVFERRDTLRRLSIAEDSSQADNIHRNEGTERRELNRNTRSRSLDERTTNMRMTMRATRRDRQQESRREPTADERRLTRADRLVRERRAPAIHDSQMRVRNFRRVAENMRMDDSARRLSERRNVDNRRSAEERDEVLQRRIRSVNGGETESRVLSGEGVELERRNLQANPIRRVNGNRAERLVQQARDDQRATDGRQLQRLSAETRRSERQAADARRSERQATETRRFQRQNADATRSERQTTDNVRRFEPQTADVRRFKGLAPDARRSDRQAADVRLRRIDNEKRSERQTADVRRSERQTLDARQTERLAGDVRRSERQIPDVRRSERQIADARPSEHHIPDVRRSERQIADARRSERQTVDARLPERLTGDARRFERQSTDVRRSERQTADERRSERQTLDARRTERLAGDVRRSERQIPDVRRSERQVFDARRSERQIADTRRSEHLTSDGGRFERQSTDVRRSERQTADARRSERRFEDVRLSERVDNYQNDRRSARTPNAIVDKREEARFAGRQNSDISRRERMSSTISSERRLGGDRRKFEGTRYSNNEERFKREILSVNGFTSFGKQIEDETDQVATGNLYKSTKDAFSNWLWKLDGLRWTELSKVGETLFYGGIMCYALFSSVNKKKAIFGN